MRKPYQFGYWRENSFDENKAFKVVIYINLAVYFVNLKSHEKIRLAVIKICKVRSVRLTKPLYLSERVN